MKRVIGICVAALSFTLAACDSGSSDDPATVSRDDLNPPRGLVTVTGDKQVELRFQTGNAEGDSFKGYHVFAAKTSAVEAAAAPGYPTGITKEKLYSTSVPRCALNTAVFEAFGFKATDRDCEGDTPSDEGTADAATDGAELQDGGEAAPEEEEEAEKLTNMVICDGNTDTTISKTATSPSLGLQSCVVKKAWNGTALEDLVNGETYTFFVVAVMGDDKSEISWTSNFVDDTPAVPMLNKSDWVVKATKQYFISAEKLATLAALAETDVVEQACVAAVCSINGANSLTEDGIYIGRLGTGDYKQRIFVSTATNSSIKIELRGNQTIDPLDNSFQTSIPGDQAIESTTYLNGTKSAVYGPVVYDIMLDKDGATHYGKIVFGQPSLATATDAASDITMSLTIIMQPQAGQVHYFQ